MKNTGNIFIMCLQYLLDKPFEHFPWMKKTWGQISLSEGTASAGYVGESRLIDGIDAHYPKIALICEHPCTHDKTRAPDPN